MEVDSPFFERKIISLSPNNILSSSDSGQFSESRTAEAASSDVSGNLLFKLSTSACRNVFRKVVNCSLQFGVLFRFIDEYCVGGSAARNSLSDVPGLLFIVLSTFFVMSNFPYESVCEASRCCKYVENAHNSLRQSLSKATCATNPQFDIFFTNPEHLDRSFVFRVESFETDCRCSQQCRKILQEGCDGTID